MVVPEDVPTLLIQCEDDMLTLANLYCPPMVVPTLLTQCEDDMLTLANLYCPPTQNFQIKCMRK